MILYVALVKVSGKIFWRNSANCFDICGEKCLGFGLFFFLFFETPFHVSNVTVHFKTFPGCSLLRLLVPGLILLDNFLQLLFWLRTCLTFCLGFSSTLPGWFSLLVSRPRGRHTDIQITQWQKQSRQDLTHLTTDTTFLYLPWKDYSWWTVQLFRETQGKNKQLYRFTYLTVTKEIGRFIKGKCKVYHSCYCLLNTWVRSRVTSLEHDFYSK